MFILLCFILLLIVNTKLNFGKNSKELIVTTALLFSSFIVLVTEFLSLFKSLNLMSIAISWTLFCLLLCYVLLQDRKGTISVLINYKTLVVDDYKGLNFYEKTLLWLILIGLLLLLFQGIIYPPNNWDSLTYHMSRIMYWLSNESVEHFPTHIIRHLYQPPFAEFFILNLNLLNGNDYLSNSVQWLFLVFTVIATWSLLDFFPVNRFYKLLAAILIITIPAVELQSSTTKNDIVCGFFIITALYFTIRTYYEPSLKNFFFLGLAIGLGVLTKGTAYLFLAPILVLFGIFMLAKLIHTKNLKILLRGFLLIFIVLMLNIGHYSRNYKIDGNLLHIDKTESKAYTNENRSAKLLISNLLKNAGLHLGYPIHEESDNIIRIIHEKMGYSLNNPDANYYGMPYEVAREITTHEDYATNLIHFILILISFFAALIYGFKNLKNNRKLLLLLLIIASQILLFVGFLKWQPWHTRLHIPIFLLSVTFVIVVANQLKWFRYMLISSIPLLVYSFCFYFVYNDIRPIITNVKYTKNIHIKEDRFNKYFANQPQLRNEYSAVLDAIYLNSSKKIGFMLSDWEYPLLYNFYYNPINIVAINVSNISKKIPQNTENIDAIISNELKTDFIIYEEKKYMNQNPNHSYIWFYK
jgi:4-amino-4-deoxy-L-arabinose transferase-like glycosyltransferase